MRHLAGWILLLAPGIAWPCGNEVTYSERLSVRQLVAAEKRLEEGDYQGVLNTLEEYSWPAGEDLVRRYTILHATASFRAYDLRRLAAGGADAIRCSGELAKSRPGREAVAVLDRTAADGVHPDPRGRRALKAALDHVPSRSTQCRYHAQYFLLRLRGGFAQATKWLQQIEFARRDDPEDPILKALAAEGMSLLPGREAAARALLEELARRDLVPDAHGWATLARLRLKRGDHPGAEAASARCRQTARDARICPSVSIG